MDTGDGRCVRVEVSIFLVEGVCFCCGERGFGHGSVECGLDFLEVDLLQLEVSRRVENWCCTVCTGAAEVSNC